MDEKKLIEENYSELVKTLLKNPKVSPPQNDRGFGSKALWTGGKMFVFLSAKKKFVVKLPQERVDELVAHGKGERWDAGRGRPMKEWLVVNSKSKSDWLEFAGESMEFVSQNSVKMKGGSLQRK